MNTKPVRLLFDDSISPLRLKNLHPRLSLYGLYPDEKETDTDPKITLYIQESRLSLVDPDLDERAMVFIDFTSGAADHRRRFGGGKSQTLAKSLGLDQKRDLTVVDATAGLAGDSFVMACLGANVFMLERSPVLALMIEEALYGASQGTGEEDLGSIIQRMQLMHVDAIDWLRQQKDESQDVVYLDPMFPERKKTAAVKKEMQLLQSLLENTPADESSSALEESELLGQARRASLFRTVVKRPRHAPPLAGEKPGYSLEGKSTRYDIYPKRAIS